MLVGASVSGSLDPFKPFHRRFTRLHNAATLIKINYTLARQFALLSLSLSPFPVPCRTRTRSFSPYVFCPFALFLSLSPFLSLPLCLPHSTLPSSFLSASFFSLSPCRFFVPHFRPPPGNAPSALSSPLARLFALYSRFNLPTSGDSLVGARSTL